MRTRELEATLKTMTKDLEQATSRMNLFEKKLQDSRSELALLKGTPDVSRDTISLSFWGFATSPFPWPFCPARVNMFMALENELSREKSLSRKKRNPG